MGRKSDSDSFKSNFIVQGPLDCFSELHKEKRRRGEAGEESGRGARRGEAGEESGRDACESRVCVGV